MPLFLKVLKWSGAILLIGFVVLVGFRTKYYFDLDKTNAQVEKIHSTKLTIDDVMGTNLPPDPGEAADDTVAGIDVNNNGIRDDVELAIFNEYPNSAKKRAVSLQYALALQMQAVQPFVNTEVVIATVQEVNRGYACIGEIFSRKDLTKFGNETNKINDFVDSKQLNTIDRKNYRDGFYEHIGSYDSLGGECDINYSVLPN